MRLKSIKLAGFKSFVDPTSLEFKSPLVAVVGPNGCGKSNVIDAVRWVMGESSARNLRGESMSDVIFNGSATRKPVGQATVELVFDNSDGSLGGEYASYAEISIRRQAGRDNQSDYFLNGTRCRRKDITDIFLGTGLGPRSYSIIEQGMISRVLEAKPEELRSFLEEAAGISLYRRRRHETEIRMRHTRENLARLDDVRQELEKQLDRLKRQAEAATRYQELKDEQEKLDAELAALRWHALAEQLDTQKQAIRTLASAFEEKMAGRASIDLELEKMREEHASKSEEYNQIHSHYYEVGTKIARNEQTLEHHRERQLQLQHDIEQAQNNIARIESQLLEDKEQLSYYLTENEALRPSYDAANEEAKNAAIVLEQASHAMQHFQEGYEKFQEDSQKTQQIAEVEKARIEQLDKQSREANAHLSRLQHEQSNLNWEALEKSLNELLQDIESREQETLNYRKELESLATELNDIRLDSDDIRVKSDASREKRQTSQGRLASLEALQQAALGKTDGVVKEWLKVAGFSENSRLGECIEVESGYETALETVLGNALEAVCVNTLEEVMTHFSSASGSIPKLNASFVEMSDASSQASIQQTSIQQAAAATATSAIAAARLSSKVKVNSEHSLDQFLSNIYVVDTLEEAMRLRSDLSLAESVVTREGIWISRHALRVFRDQGSRAGVIEREAEIKELQALIQQLNSSISEYEIKFEENRDKILQLEKERESLLQKETVVAKELKDLTGKSSALRARLEHTRNRLNQVQQEMAEYQQRLTLAQEDAGLARLELQSALDEMEACRNRRESLATERQNLRTLLSDAERNLSASKDALHSKALKLESLKAQQEATKQGILRLEESLSSVTEQKIKLSKTIQDLEQPTEELRLVLDELLSERVEIEKELNQARNIVESLDNDINTLEKRRVNFEQEAENIRGRLDEARMQVQALEIRSQTVQEKLQAVQKSAEEIWKTLEEGAEETLWAERLEQVSNRIQRLGAINMAAIEEFQTESERKNYLDSQFKDLTEALETLDNAIQKIDKETRMKFKETYDKVNAEFQTLFPRLFGGGQAYLELVGEDLLEAGVAVMARPPGKKNSSIHLLSGGEKALTAVALVFAIFQLNPAPFCMLDEVDAPLDDANVGRFCELVKHMSSTVQFIYITHNKLSMESANILVGVTMKEPGVSRLVSVNVAEAYEMAMS